MHFELSEFSLHFSISGFSTRPDSVDEVLKAVGEKFPEVSLQLVDLERIPGSRFLHHAIFNALKSFHSEQPIARSLGIEILLYVAATRQISEAIERVGITSGTRKIVALAVGKSFPELTNLADFLRTIFRAEGDDGLIDDWSTQRVQNVQQIFGIGPKEIQATIRARETAPQAIERLAIERSALLTIKK